jgi:DNA-directed RNA polymerase beta subunit
VDPQNIFSQMLTSSKTLDKKKKKKKNQTINKHINHMMSFGEETTRQLTFFIDNLNPVQGTAMTRDKPKRT